LKRSSEVLNIWSRVYQKQVSSERKDSTFGDRGTAKTEVERKTIKQRGQDSCLTLKMVMT
jgi:hypothetical protein